MCTLLKICSSCKRENDDADFFCIYCGDQLTQQTIDESQQPVNETSQLITETKEADIVQSPFNFGRLVLPDNSEIAIDQSRRLVGRADLIEFTKNDPNEISRRHFAVFKRDDKYYFENIATNITDKTTQHHTYFNNKQVLDKEKIVMSDGDSIKISDVELKIRLG